MKEEGFSSSPNSIVLSTGKSLGFCPCVQRLRRDSTALPVTRMQRKKTIMSTVRKQLGEMFELSVDEIRATMARQASSLGPQYAQTAFGDRKSTRLNSSHANI